MTDTGEYHELEPLDEGSSPISSSTTSPGTGPYGGAVQPPGVPELTLQALRSGLPAPAYNPRADKFYFRFLFAGLIMLLGCLMPFGPEWQMSGYKTLSGALFLLISLGICWSAWGAISSNRFEPRNMKWIVFAMFPLIVELMNLIAIFDEPAVADAIRRNEIIPRTWGEIWDAIKGSMPLARVQGESAKLDTLLRLFGTGKLMLLLGSFLAEFYFIKSIFGATKVIKNQKAAAMAARRGA